MLGQYSSVKYFVSEISAQKEDGTAGGSRQINFIEDKFSYLNIAVVSRRFVERSLQCALMCLGSLPCFSFNLAAFPDNNNKLLCEHLPSDKYNNSEKFIPSNAFHHFSIWVSKKDFMKIFQARGRAFQFYCKDHVQITKSLFLKATLRNESGRKSYSFKHQNVLNIYVALSYERFLKCENEDWTDC